jgi:hypothetical protein
MSVLLFANSLLLAVYYSTSRCLLVAQRPEPNLIWQNPFSTRFLECKRNQPKVKEELVLRMCLVTHPLLSQFTYYASNAKAPVKKPRLHTFPIM